MGTCTVSAAESLRSCAAERTPRVASCSAAAPFRAPRVRDCSCRPTEQLLPYLAPLHAEYAGWGWAANSTRPMNLCIGSQRSGEALQQYLRRAHHVRSLALRSSRSRIACRCSVALRSHADSQQAVQRAPVASKMGRVQSVCDGILNAAHATSTLTGIINRYRVCLWADWLTWHEP